MNFGWKGKDDKVRIIPGGMRYSHYGDRTGNFAGERDAENIMNNYDKELQAYGGAGMRKYISMYNSDGTPCTTPQNIDGRLYYPSPLKNVFAIIDEDGVNNMVQIDLDVERHIDDLVMKCLVSNKVQMLLLGTNFFDMLGAPQDTNADILKNVFNGAADTARANGQAEFLRACGAGTEKYALGLAKLRAIVRLAMPIMQKQGTTESIIKNTQVDATYDATKSQVKNIAQ